jgi:hypothetical protein
VYRWRNELGAGIIHWRCTRDRIKGRNHNGRGHRHFYQLQKPEIDWNDFDRKQWRKLLGEYLTRFSIELRSAIRYENVSLGAGYSGRGSGSGLSTGDSNESGGAVRCQTVATAVTPQRKGHFGIAGCPGARLQLFSP